MRLPSRSDMKTKWKTILAIMVAASASFSMGAFANQVIVQQVQSLAGNHVLVPAPELQIISSSFAINGTASLVTGIILNVTTVGAPSASGTKLYQIFIQVSCFTNVVPPTEFTCATGSNTITLPVNMNGAFAFLTIPITPPIDPETTEVHDLSFIVTGTPTPIPAQCTSTFSVKAFPTVLNITRNTASPVNGNVTKTLTYAGTCPKATISLTAIAKGPGPPGTPQGVQVNIFPNVLTLPPSPATVTELITVQPTTLPGQYQVLETDTSGPVVVTTVVIVNVN